MKVEEHLKIDLRPVTVENYKACAQLKTLKEQEAFVSPNWCSLLEACYEKERFPFGIYAEETLVGFVMFSYYPADEVYPISSWWIERFMIAHQFQHIGLGTKALQASLQWFYDNHLNASLRLSANKENTVALKLYEKQGFVQTGEEVAGELVLLDSNRMSQV